VSDTIPTPDVDDVSDVEACDEVLVSLTGALDDEVIDGVGRAARKLLTGRVAQPVDRLAVGAGGAVERLDRSVEPDACVQLSQQWVVHVHDGLSHPDCDVAPADLSGGVPLGKSHDLFLPYLVAEALVVESLLLAPESSCWSPAVVGLALVLTSPPPRASLRSGRNPRTVSPGLRSRTLVWIRAS
jgi:hypothetical protein